MNKINSILNLNVVSSSQGVPSYSPDEQSCVDDMQNLLTLIDQIKSEKNAPGTGDLRELCLIIQNLNTVCQRLSQSSLPDDRTMAENAMFSFQIPQYGQYSFLTAAEAYSPSHPDDVSAMQTTFTNFVKATGSEDSLIYVLGQLVSNPWVMPTPPASTY